MNMRFLMLFILSVMAVSLPAKAQAPKIGLTVTPLGENVVFVKSGLDGGPGLTGDGFYNVGLTCQFPLTKRWDLETGVEFSKHTIVISSHHVPTPLRRKEKIGFACIPVTVKMNFLKYFFVNGGCLVDLDINASSRSLDNQSGLGAVLGVGARYDFNFGGTIFANPYINCHSLLHFQLDKYHERLAEIGIRFGFLFSLEKF